MKRQLTVMSFLCSVLFISSLGWSSCKAKKEISATPPAVETPTAPEMPAFMKALKAKVAGKENLPAEEVWENIKILKGMPAGRVLGIMQMGFAKSLGVKCNHCHEFNNWASDAKPQKQVAREMWEMTGKINQELLTKIDNLQSERAVVNCTTCHRGEIKPATNLGN